MHAIKLAANWGAEKAKKGTDAFICRSHAVDEPAASAEWMRRENASVPFFGAAFL
jgi:hypothetical protein